MKIVDIFEQTITKTITIILLVSYAGIASAELVDLTGPAPEEASITVTVNKRADAATAEVSLSVFDADIHNEGELIINGNPAITLFGESGVAGNDNKSASVVLTTPASYWHDGDNTLLFRHTRTGGYVINDVSVIFAGQAPESEPSPVIDTLPVDLTGAAPEDSTITVTVNKPSNANSGYIAIDAYDADRLNEGELIINGNPAITLFGEFAVSSNNSKSASVVLTTPASYWRDGDNTLLFRHTQRDGYIVNDVRVIFTVNVPEPEPEPNADTLPIDLTGAAPEETSITVNADKPINASNGLITLVSYDADIRDEGELIINGNPAIKLFGDAGVPGNDSKSTNIYLDTPASYWRDGQNTLRFRHTRTGGYIIENVSVNFSASEPVPDPAPNPDPEPDPAPNPDPEPDPGTHTLPLDLTGAAPEESSITVSVSKPFGASNGLITLNAYDADILDEGELIINGNPAIKLFGSDGVAANDSRSVDITFSTPATYWRDGNNTLLFKHTRTGGYKINDVSVQFELSGNRSVSLDWVAPAARVDESALSLSEIDGYTVYYGTSAGNYTNSMVVNDSSATAAIVNNLPAGTYYLVVTTRDTGGRESDFSSMVTKQAQ